MSGFDNAPSLTISLLPFLGFIYLIYHTIRVKNKEGVTKNIKILSVILVIIELYILICIYRYGFLERTCLLNSYKVAAKSDSITRICSFKLL